MINTAQTALLMDDIQEYKLFMILLGARPPGRHVEQHDFFFAIGRSMQELIPAIKAFWPDARNSMHVDGWREVNHVDGYKINVVLKKDAADNSVEKLFFINLGGYSPNRLEEQHYTVLTVQTDRAFAIQEAKRTLFFKTNTIRGNGANPHIDDKYGIDVDDIYNIEEMLLPAQKAMFKIEVKATPNLPEDKITLGYFKLDKLAKM